MRDNLLSEQRTSTNNFTYRGYEYSCDLEDTREAIRRLKPKPDRLKELRRTIQGSYDRLVLGTTIIKSIDGDSKSYSFRYVDGEAPENNVVHVTAEFSSSQSKRCDILALLNDSRFLVTENKRPIEGFGPNHPGVVQSTVRSQGGAAYSTVTDLARLRG